MPLIHFLLTIIPTLPAASSQLLPPTSAYAAIGQISLSSTCTATFIQTPANGPAYALTAGHCYSLNAQEVFLNLDAPANTRPIRFNFFAETSAGEQIPIPIRRIAYATMKGADLMLLELAATRDELAARITPLVLEPATPPTGEPISIIGIPASFFDQTGRFLRRSRCTLGPPADLIEFTWHFYNTRRNDCEDIVGGISGSPVLSERTGRVIGIVNTTTHLAWSAGGDFDCYAGRPCELSNNTQRVEEETSYSIPVAGLLNCFNSAGDFSLANDACPLDRGRPLTITRRQRTQKPGATWAATITTTAPTYRYKAITAGASQDCRDNTGYSQPISTPTIDDPIPAEENRYLLCVVPEGVPTRDATVVIARIDSTPPILPPYYSVTQNESNYRIPFEFIPPELSSYSYKFGPPETTQCDDTGYRPYLRIPISLPIREGPYRFCFFTQDEADNRSKPYGLLIGAGPAILPQGIGHAAGFRPPVYAPGQWISIYGLQLETLRLPDLTIGYQSDTQINARLPQNLPKGQIQIGAETLTIDTISPGILHAAQTGPNEIAIYTTGLAKAAPAELTATIGRTKLTIHSIEPDLETGLELLHLSLPPNHGLQGRQFLQINNSNRASIVLK
ncbi:MAG: trypsin-like peptidase domain-containing protein [Acidobacteria bacterium]|nr:trypsin-like peptidase domain-containing protein [Acidobacteriota bacterium]